MKISNSVQTKTMLKLPEELRDRLKKPLGILERDVGKIVEIIREKNPPRTISVGDFVSSSLISAGLLPDIMIVDFKIERREAPKDVLNLICSQVYREVRVKNAAGTLSPQLWRVLEEAGGRTRIVVEGEEDLATIPAVLVSPPGSIVLYGQPGQGTVLVEVTEEKKQELARILEKFIPVEEEQF